MINRRDVNKALAVANTVAWLPPELARCFAASGNPALRTAGQAYALGDMLPFASVCEVSGLVLQIGKVTKAEPQADGSWWYEVELQAGARAERIPEDIWNAVVAEGNAPDESGEVIRFVV